MNTSEIVDSPILAENQPLEQELQKLEMNGMEATVESRGEPVEAVAQADHTKITENDDEKPEVTEPAKEEKSDATIADFGVAKEGVESEDKIMGALVESADDKITTLDDEKAEDNAPVEKGKTDGIFCEDGMNKEVLDKTDVKESTSDGTGAANGEKAEDSDEDSEW